MQLWERTFQGVRELPAFAKHSNTYELRRELHSQWEWKYHLARQVLFSGRNEDDA